MSVLLRATACLPLVVALSACGQSYYCKHVDAKYSKAASIQPIESVEGLQLPDSPTALRVPPPPAHDTSFGYPVADPKNPGKTRIQCLDKPPPLTSETSG